MIKRILRPITRIAAGVETGGVKNMVRGFYEAIV
jgi:hypothetical protein